MKAYLEGVRIKNDNLIFVEEGQNVISQMINKYPELEEDDFESVRIFVTGDNHANSISKRIRRIMANTKQRTIERVHSLLKQLPSLSIFQ